MQEVLLLASPMLFQRLNLIAKRLVVCDQLLLISAVIVGVLAQLDSGMGDMDLQFLALVLGIADEFFVNMYISLQIIDNLNYEELQFIL
jgi:hypothetical protein